MFMSDGPNGLAIAHARERAPNDLIPYRRISCDVIAKDQAMREH
jgi:hypothetical protein